MVKEHEKFKNTHEKLSTSEDNEIEILGNVLGEYQGSTIILNLTICFLISFGVILISKFYKI